MLPFLLATDSGCDLPLEYCRQNQIAVLHMKYTLNGEEYSESMEVADLAAFYEAMAQGAVVHTSALNMNDYLEFWRPLASRKLPIVHIAMGSGISSSYQNACLAKEALLEEMPDLELHLVDSLGACMVYGMQVMEAVRLRELGCSAADCERLLLEYRHHCLPCFTTDNLEYLHRGGRVSRTGMVIAHTLGIRPIMNLNAAGGLQVVEKARGKRKTFDKAAEMIAQNVIKPEKQTLYVLHANAPEEAKDYAEAICARSPFCDVKYHYIGTTIGAHTGPGLVSAYYYGKAR